MKKYEITPNDAEQRLDKFLKKLFPNASLGFLYKSLRKGNIKVFKDRKKSKQDREYKLQVGEVVQIYLSDSEIHKLSEKQNTAKKITVSSELSKKDIVFEDNDILVLNKNPWQNVHPWDHKTTEVSLIDQVHDYYKKSLDSLTFKPSLAHRIDRDTSGIIMIGKTKKGLTELVTGFKSHTKIKKTYFCLVVGKVSRKSGTISKKLHRIENAHRENKVQVLESWLEAITHYKVLDEYKVLLPQWEQVVTSLEVTIETGRMHQIRVHLTTLWNPILWDKSYGDKKLNAYFSKNFFVTRQMLHAWKIEFRHPITHKKMSLEARLKKDMKEFVSKIKS